MLFLPCAGGVEALLADEAARIVGGQPEPARGGVWVDAASSGDSDELAAMRLNLESRLATRVLVPLADGPYRDEHDLYDIARRVDWGRWLTPADTLRVDVQAMRSPLTSLNFAALRIKDAICDALRESHGDRPSVDTRSPDLPVSLFVGPDHAMLYADTSGEPLFKRGWREATGEAPLKETLAAAMLAAIGWQGRPEDGPLLDPCCGAGTIAIEAAQLACGIAPGGLRRFAFERQRPFQAHRAAWAQMQQQARTRVHAPGAPVFAGDVSFRMTDFAQRNAERAGVARAIEFKTADAQQRPPPAARGTILMNPPYGERIAPKGMGNVTSREGFEGGGSSAEFFSGLASHWKRQYAGWTAWLLSPDPKLPGLMRMKESRRVPLYNGAIECRLFRFELTAGAGPGGRERAGPREPSSQ
jgi:putative N6-adenine-specific DNA methylase